MVLAAAAPEVLRASGPPSKGRERCSCRISLVHTGIVALGPETKGRPLPEERGLIAPSAAHDGEIVNEPTLGMTRALESETAAEHGRATGTAGPKSVAQPPNSASERQRGVRRDPVTA